MKFTKVAAEEDEFIIVFAQYKLQTRGLCQLELTALSVSV